MTRRNPAPRAPITYRRALTHCLLSGFDLALLIGSGDEATCTQVQT